MSGRAIEPQEHRFELHAFPSVVDLARYFVDQAKSNTSETDWLVRVKRNMGYNLALLGGNRNHVRLYCGLSDSQARTLSETAEAESFFVGAKLPGLETSRILWQILASQFGCIYWNLAGSRMCTDVVFESVLEAWFYILNYYSKSEWVLLAPYVSNLGMFMDWAMWFREGRLSFQYCPHCGLYYVRHEVVKSDERELKEEATKPKRRSKKKEGALEIDTDCPYCKLRSLIDG